MTKSLLLGLENDQYHYITHPKESNLSITNIIDFGTSQPFISEIRSAIQVNGSDDFHIRYSRMSMNTAW